jgi:sugar phosphate isomerase/epimerase
MHPTNRVSCERNVASGVMTRRAMVSSGLSAVAMAAGALPLGHARSEAPTPSQRTNQFCAFVKFIQALPYDTLAERIAELGFDGIEATVRKGGLVRPERVEDDLPRLVEALAKHDLAITVVTSDVTRADNPLHEKLVRTAARLKVPRYRMGWYRYDLTRSIDQQIDEIGAVIKDLVALNREAGITAVYQNHCGSKNFGAPLWDLHRVIRDYPVGEMGVAFDIRHATVEGGMAWPINFKLMQPHLGAVYVKDFRWVGRGKVENVPLGKGQVSPEFFSMLADAGYDGPISVHVEYLQDAGPDKNVAALGADLTTLRRLLAAQP